MATDRVEVVSLTIILGFWLLFLVAAIMAWASAHKAHKAATETLLVVTRFESRIQGFLEATQKR